MNRSPSSHPPKGSRGHGLVFTAYVVGALAAAPTVSDAQLTLTTAQAAAREASPDLQAPREAVAAAAGRERQAGAFANPTLSYGREQTSRAGQTNSQNVAQLEQPLEVGGQRAARREAARLRRAAAEARLEWAGAQLDFDVARAFARALAADRRATIAQQAEESFVNAQGVAERRLAAGDVSGYVVRRIQLEAARHASLAVAADAERRSTRVALASLIGIPSAAADSLTLPAAILETEGISTLPPLDSLVGRAARNRWDLTAEVLEAEAEASESRVVARERTPTPVLSVGYKGERVAGVQSGSSTDLAGFVAGLSVPLPLFDRRSGAVAAAVADARGASARADATRRRVAREVVDAVHALRAAQVQRATLRPHIGEGALIAVRAVQTAYAEGEITLAEWLDAVRAHQEAESIYVTLNADVAVARAAYVRAIGDRTTTPSTTTR